MAESKKTSVKAWLRVNTGSHIYCYQIIWSRVYTTYRCSISQISSVTKVVLSVARLASSCASVEAFNALVDVSSTTAASDSNLCRTYSG